MQTIVVDVPGDILAPSVITISLALFVEAEVIVTPDDVQIGAAFVVHVIIRGAFVPAPPFRVTESVS